MVADNVGSEIAGGVDAKTENITQDNTITNPSRQIAVKDLRNAFPTLLVGSPAKLAKGSGEMASVMYSLKNREYTVKIMMSDSTQTTRLPNKVTSHRGLESKNPTSLILVMISAGNVVALAAVNPEALMAEPMVPCTMLKIAIRNSKPKSIRALANTKRINNLNACSGLFSSAKFH